MDKAKKTASPCYIHQKDSGLIFKESPKRKSFIYLARKPIQLCLNTKKNFKKF